MPLEIPAIFETKARYSADKIVELTERISEVGAASRIPSLAIFVAGSYARLEASQHSDLDLFFVCRGDRGGERDRRTNELELFGELIRIAKELGFPKFSGDCRYLEIHAEADVLSYLGGREDDYRNFFTLRLLLLLESRPLFGSSTYEAILDNFIDSYFRDYPKHQNDFVPTFLINDIARYWRTLLANYEHLRNQKRDESATIEQKVRNFKIKYSRLTTCFATIAALASFDTPVSAAHVKSVVVKTTRERLEMLADRWPDVETHVQAIIDRYADFLILTESTTADLEAMFRSRDTKRRLFDNANAYGDLFFDLLRALDGIPALADRKVLRTLVV